MDSISLELLWDKIIYDGKTEYVLRRIDSVCIPEVNIGLNSSLKRCLFLELPREYEADFQKIIRQNLTLELLKDTNYIVLELTDDSFYDLFNDLVISLYLRVKDVSDVDTYSKVFIQTFHKWSEFFHDQESDRLSQDVIKGLFGELFVLKLLVEDSNSSIVNDRLKSWKGPYDQGHDFILDSKDIEVKTKNVTKVSVRISSEQQLDCVSNRPLELFVLSVEQDSIHGISIKDLVVDIKTLVINMLGDTSILLKAINQKGLTLKNIHDYDNFRYLPIKKSIYDCTKEGFPKLVKSNIPKSTSNITYDINLLDLDDYLLTSESL